MWLAHRNSWWLICLGALAVLAACESSASKSAEPVRLYTSVTEDTVDAVVTAYREAQPGAQVEVFKAPTGPLNARIAAERREGGIRADVLWLTDPPSIQQYAQQDLLRRWTPEHSSAVPLEYRSDTFWGTRLLYMVIVHHADAVPAPSSWRSLTRPAYRVAIPDPTYAGSAHGALSFFGLAEGFGLDYYRDLKANGATQVLAPDEVVAEVAEGRFDAGMTLDYSVRVAKQAGSPVELVWPDPGGVAMHSPIAVFESASDPEGAEDFVDFVLTRKAQEAIASTGWHPIRGDVPGPPVGSHATADWSKAFRRQEEFLQEYRAIFGG